MKRKIIPLILCLSLLLSLFSGCSETPGEKDQNKITVIASIFPEYDWIREIIGDESDRFDLTLLLDNGVDLHSYQPSADDIVKLSNCDLFVYTGGESDEWVADALNKSIENDISAVNLLELLGDSAKEEEVVEGMQEEEHEHEHEEDHEEHDDDDHDHGEEPEYDEHIWLSVKNASVLTGSLAEKIAEIDPDKKDVYLANAQSYQKKLLALDEQYQAAVDAGSIKTVLFGDRFPFRYLTDDYGLQYYAAFIGCSAETEASFETIAFLASKADELGLHTILQIETSDGSIANTVKNATQSKDQEILTMNSMQAIDSEDISGGITYLSVMEDNLNVLKKAIA